MKKNLTTKKIFIIEEQLFIERKLIIGNQVII